MTYISVLVTFVGHFNQIVNNLEEKFRPAAEKKSVIHLMNELNRATLDAIALVIALVIPLKIRCI